MNRSILIQMSDHFQETFYRELKRIHDDAFLRNDIYLQKETALAMVDLEDINPKLQLKQPEIGEV